MSAVQAMLQPTPGSGEASSRAQVTIKDLLHGKALGLLDNRNRLRVVCAKLLTHKMFEHAVLLLILASSVQLTLDAYGLDPNSGTAKALHVLDIFFCIVFGMEALLKVCVMGLVANGPGSYLRSPWNVLDAAVVVVQVLVLVLEALVDSSKLTWMQALRSLRWVAREQAHCVGLDIRASIATWLPCQSQGAASTTRCQSVGRGKGGCNRCAPRYPCRG
jgi:hypothetical protein